MDRQRLSAVIAATVAAVQSSTDIVVSSIRAAMDELDNRSFRAPNCRQWTIPTTQFTIAEQDPVFWESWYVHQFRCSKSSFDQIVQMIETNWLLLHSPIGRNAHFTIRWRVAVTLHYLCHSGSIVDSAHAFGMSKSSAWRFIDQVARVLVDIIGPSVIKLPNSAQEWNELSEGFEAIAGFPDTCLAIDGVLFEIERPFDHEGWYCRKGFPAINALVVVDFSGKIRDYALRPGSENDKGVYNRSNFSSIISKILPVDKVIVADAGYQLFVHCMTPYPTENATASRAIL